MLIAVATADGGETREMTPAEVSALAVSVPAPVPQSISRRQFYQQLAAQAIISEAETLAALGPGTIPSELAAVVAKLPADQQFAANCFLMAVTEIDRNHPMTVAIGAAYGWTSAQIDALFVAAAAL